MIGIVTQEDLEDMVKHINELGEETKKLREDYDQLVLELKDMFGKKEEEETEEEPEEPEEKEEKKPKFLKKFKKK